MRDKELALAAPERELAELFALPARDRQAHHDYLKAGAWVFAVLFGPALIALTVLIVSGLA